MKNEEYKIYPVTEDSSLKVMPYVEGDAERIFDCQLQDNRPEHWQNGQVGLIRPLDGTYNSRQEYEEKLAAAFEQARRILTA